MKQRNHNRADGSTKISISISKDLLNKIDSKAKGEYRTRSNLIQMMLHESVAEYTTDKDKKE